VNASTNNKEKLGSPFNSIPPWTIFKCSRELKTKKENQSRAHDSNDQARVCSLFDQQAIRK
jgi:hypothetical protein